MCEARQAEDEHTSVQMVLWVRPEYCVMEYEYEETMPKCPFVLIISLASSSFSERRVEVGDNKRKREIKRERERKRKNKW